MKHPQPRKQAGATPAGCRHDYVFDPDLEGWVCRLCGRALDLTSQHRPHECGPDCDQHDQIGPIG